MNIPKCNCCNIINYNINSINDLNNSYLNNCVAVIIEKECGFNFITYQNELSTTLDLYRYVEQSYKHINKEKILYIDKDKNKILFKNDNILLKQIFSDNKMLSVTNLPEKTIYKLYLLFI